jgi:hypothetical protein
MAKRKLTVQEAAEALDTSVDAIRQRIKRGKLPRAEPDDSDDNRVYVWLDGNHTEARHHVEGEISANLGALVESLQDQVQYLHEQLDREREANRENRRLLAAALERIPPQLEAPPEPPGAPETAVGEPEGPPSLEAVTKGRRRALRGHGGGGCSVGNVGWTFITTGVRALAGIAVGGYITYRVSRHHFRRASGQQEEVATLENSNPLIRAQAEKASAELKARADRLHLVVTVLALDMERDGLLTGVMRDESDLLKGVPQVVDIRPPAATSRKTDREPHRDALRQRDRPRSLEYLLPFSCR